VNGLDVLKRIREVGLETPVIFLTEYADPVFEETALLVGAVDFVNKSRGFSILHRRVRLVLNGSKYASGQKIPFEAAGPGEKPSDKSGLWFDTTMGRVHWRGARVRLSASEVKVVSHLIENTDKFIGHREIYDLIRGHGFLAGTGPDGYRANVRAFLKRVRQKFRDVNPEFDEIENYPGLGYRWSGEVTVVDVDDADPDPAPCCPEPFEAPCAPG
jgi:two-component system response regulator ChvI